MRVNWVANVYAVVAGLIASLCETRIDGNRVTARSTTHRPSQMRSTISGSQRLAATRCDSLRLGARQSQIAERVDFESAPARCAMVESHGWRQWIGLASAGCRALSQS